MYGKKTSASKTKDSALVLHGVTITHPERIVFPDVNVTKGDVARYYAAAAPYLLREIKNRPISLLRCPSGTTAECFFQRNVGFGLGPDVLPFDWHYKGRSFKYIYVRDARGIMEMIQMGVLEIHPWGSTVDNVHNPDRVIFDFDPDPAVAFTEVRKAARELRARLKKRGLECFLKCTGGKGLHVIVPLKPVHPWAQVKAWAAALAQEMVAEKPEVYVATITKAKRKGKILIDYFRNDYTATAVAGYSLRARPGAPVAVPLDWEELGRLRSGHDFTIEKTLKCLSRKKPAAIPPLRQNLPVMGEKKSKAKS